MYDDQTYDVILKRMLDRVSDKFDKRPSSVIYDTHSATAIELQILYIELQEILKNSYGDTASREFLTLLARDRGLEPNKATKAILKGRFTPSNVDVTGRRFNIGEINYVVLQHIGDGEYKVQCETAGIIGNKYLDTMIPMEYIQGLQTAELIEVLIPGEDEEDTESFRKRYFASFNAQAFGGNHADYIAKVKSIDGVGSVKVERVWNSDMRPVDMIPNNTVDNWYNSYINTLENKEIKNWLTSVYTAASKKKLTVGGTVHIIITDSNDYSVASKELINSVQEIIDPEQNAGEGYGLAPIGHVVYIESAKPINIQVSTKIVFDNNYSWQNTHQQIEKVVDAYLLELRKTWSDVSQTIIRIAQIEGRILGVTGVIDISNTMLNGKNENIALDKYEIPILRGVTV